MLYSLIEPAVASSRACMCECPSTRPERFLGLLMRLTELCGPRCSTLLFSSSSTVIQQVNESVKRHILSPNSRSQGLAARNRLWTHFTSACSFLFKNSHLFGHVPSVWPCFAGQSYDVHRIIFSCLTDVCASFFHLRCGKR